MTNSINKIATKEIKLTKGILNFINYGYKGDGKYYTACYGSQHFNQTEYNKFANNYPQFVNILESGNDAPKGGKVGNYDVVIFSEDFKIAAKNHLDKIEAEKQAVLKEKEMTTDLIKSYASLITKVEGETRQDTEKRLSNALNMKINATHFHKSVSIVRNS
jgi:hypothetical protein